MEEKNIINNESTKSLNAEPTNKIDFLKAASGAVLIGASILLAGYGQKLIRESNLNIGFKGVIPIKS